jgi:hypothetical protein
MTEATTNVTSLEQAAEHFAKPGAGSVRCSRTGFEDIQATSMEQAQAFYEQPETAANSTTTGDNDEAKNEASTTSEETANEDADEDQNKGTDEESADKQS